MSKVRQNLIRVNLKANNLKLAVHIALLDCIEGCVVTLMDGTVMQSVYLDNAYDLVKSGMTRHQFAGYLSALTKDGLYRHYDDDGYFGQVVTKIATQPEE